MSRPIKAYNSVYNRYIKRILDIGISGTALLVIWPIYGVIGFLVYKEDGGPVFYRAERGGYKGKNFRICKFRTMVVDADKIGGGTTALNDPRITKIGAFLRKTKLDELPQIMQVFTGSMSLVGPRPELPQYVSQYTPEEQQILQVRPGITDYSSLRYINLDEVVGETNADEYYEKYVLANKNKLRLEYANTVSFMTDARILFKTLFKTLEKGTKEIKKL